MSSLRRQLSSQANGRHSRGPATPEGKARSSQNAVSHGLLANCVVLPGESLEGFEALFAKHLERFGPVDGVELAMIEEMAAAYWRMRRAWSMENELLTSCLDPNSAGESSSRITAAFRQLASSPELALLHRYETRLHMMYQRALHNILLLRTASPLFAQDVEQDVGQVTDLPADQPPPASPAPLFPDTSPTDPAATPSEPAPEAPATPGIPNEPSPTPGHSDDCPDRHITGAKPIPHSRCRRRGASLWNGRQALNPPSVPTVLLALSKSALPHAASRE